jgi:Zn-dependent protease with chaperone function
VILPYLGRLFCLGLSAFFLIHTAASLGVCLAAARVVRSSISFDPKVAARILLCLRLFPVLISVVLVLALFGPSYLLFEPQDSTESIGVPCVVTSIFGAALLAAGVLRGAVAMRRSSAYLRKSVESGAPVMLVAGLFRTRVVVSSSIRDSLTAEELEAALRHEEAHRRAKDNLKRLFILMSPTALPFSQGFQALEAGWQRVAEWAADDCAAQASTRDAIALASALIRVGRMSTNFPSIVLSTSLLADVGDLRTRIERLVEGPRSYPQLPIRSALGFVTLMVLCAIGLSPALLPASHRFLEALAH